MKPFLFILIAILLLIAVVVLAAILWRRGAGTARTLKGAFSQAGQIITQPPTIPPGLDSAFLLSATPYNYATLVDRADQKSYPLDDLLGSPIHIGRNADNQIVIDDPTVSGRHARIYFDQSAQRICIEDLDSLNGVYLDGRPTRKNVLNPGAVIELGNRQFAFDNTGYIHPSSS